MHCVIGYHAFCHCYTWSTSKSPIVTYTNRCLESFCRKLNFKLVYANWNAINNAVDETIAACWCTKKSPLLKKISEPVAWDSAWLLFARCFQNFHNYRHIVNYLHKNVKELLKAHHVNWMRPQARPWNLRNVYKLKWENLDRKVCTCGTFYLKPIWEIQKLH